MFAASQLIAAADARFGQNLLRSRVAPGASSVVKDAELLKIAQSVIGAFQSALQSSEGWPLPGQWPTGSISPIDGTTDISGQAFADLWPYDLIEQALQFLDFRSYAGLEMIPAEKIRLGQMSQQFLVNLAKGVVGVGIGGPTDTTPVTPIAARDRAGNNTLNDGAADMPRVLDFFDGRGWDWVILFAVLWITF